MILHVVGPRDRLAGLARILIPSRGMSASPNLPRALSLFLFVCAFSMLAPAASAAGAQEAEAAPGDDAARTHFESGRLHFERDEYTTALNEFEEAYELSGRVGLLYNIYLTLERLGRVGEAADRLEQFLRDDPSIEADRRTNLESRVIHLRARAAEEAAAAAREAEPPASSGGGLGPLGTAGIVTLAAGGASLIVFAIAGPLALTEDAAVSERCGETAGRFCTEEDVSTLRTLVALSDATMAIGLVLAAAGGTMLAIDLAMGSSSSSEDRAVSLLPMLGPDHAGLVIGGVL